MKRRPLGATGITVGEIGLGAWQLANPDWGLYDRAEALRVVQQALDAGCDFFDTAPPYGGGRSERLLGRALAGVHPSVTICTKFGHSAERRTNFDVAALRPSLEASLQRLRTDYVDVLLLHNPPVELMDGTRAPHYEEMERLKAEGKLRVYGVSLDHPQELETVLATTRSGALEVYFNVLHQELRAGFPRAREQGVGLIVKVPLDSGWLSGKYRGDSRFTDLRRRRWSPDVITRRARLVEQVAALVPPGISLAHVALRYVLAQPEISTVIPGAKTVAQVSDNAAVGDGRLPDDVVRALDALWERELRDDPLPW